MSDFETFVNKWHETQSSNAEVQLQHAYFHIEKISRTTQKYRALQFIEEQVSANPERYKKVYEKNPMLRFKETVAATDPASWPDWSIEIANSHPLITLKYWRELEPNQQASLRQILLEKKQLLEENSKQSAARINSQGLLAQNMTLFFNALDS